MCIYMCIYVCVLLQEGGGRSYTSMIVSSVLWVAFSLLAAQGIKKVFGMMKTSIETGTYIMSCTIVARADEREREREREIQ